MNICVACKKEMTCAHTGTNVRWGHDGSHVYRGDRFRCPICGFETVICNSTPIHDNNPVIKDNDVLMEPIRTHKKAINLRGFQTEEPTESTSGRTCDNCGMVLNCLVYDEHGPGACTHHGYKYWVPRISHKC